MNKKTVSANTIWILCQQIYSMVVSLIVGSISAKYLGPSNYGVITYGASLITLASTVAKLGLDGIIIKRLSEKPEDENKVIGSALLLRTISSFAFFIIVNLFALIVHNHETSVRIVILLQSVAMLFNVYEIFVCSFQAKLEYKISCLVIAIAATLAGASKVILIIRKSPVELFAIPTIIQAFVGFVLIIVLYKIRYHVGLKIEKAEMRSLLKNSYHILLSAIAVTIYTQLDKILIKTFMDSAAVGIYSAATVLAMLWEFIPQAIMNAYRTEIYRNIDQKEKFDDIMKRILSIISVLSGVIIIGYFVLGRVLLLVVYDINYIDALIPMWIIALSTGLAMISTLRGIWMIAKGYQKYDKYCVLIGALLNLVLNIIFIPRFGIIGAAVTTLIAQFANGILATLLFRDTRPYLLYFKSVPKYIVMEIRQRLRKGGSDHGV